MNSDTQTVRRPWPISLAILGIWIVIALGGELLQVRGQPTGLDELATSQIIIGVVIAMLFLIGAISYLRWWPLVGWKRPDQWRDLRLLWLPALALLTLMGLVMFVDLPSTQVILFVVINTLLVGISEELMFRGVLFHGASNSFGVMRAVWITALLFGLVHALNGFITGNFAAALAQALLAGMFGVWMGALRVRLNTIIPLIIIHWLWDCFLFLTSLWGGLVAIPFALALFLYGLWLLRGVRRNTESAATAAV